MRLLLILLFGSLFLGSSYPEVTPTIIFYRSFYSEMKALEKPARVTAFAAVQQKAGWGNPSGLTATTTNNLIVVTFFIIGNTDVTSITDGAGNTYAQANSIYLATNGVKLHQYYACQTTGGATSITISPAASRYVVNEYSGAETTNAAVFDASTTGGETNSDSPAVSTLTPAATGELIVAGMVNSAGATVSAGSGYTIYGNASDILTNEYKLVGGASETAPYSLPGAAYWGEIATAFIAKAAPDPAPALNAAGNVAKTKYKYKNNE